MHLTGKRPELPDVLCDGNPPTQALRDLHRSLLARNRTDRPPHAGIVAKILKKLAVGKTIDVAKILLSATTHEEALSVENRRKERNVALLTAGRTDETIKRPAMVGSEAEAVASAPTQVAMSTEEARAHEALLTGPDIPSDQGSQAHSSLVTSDEQLPQAKKSSGAPVVIAAAIVAVVVAISLVIGLGGGDNDAPAGENSAISTAESTREQKVQTPEETVAASSEAAEKVSSEVATRGQLAPEAAGEASASVELVTEPAGVSVESGGAFLGKTPLEVTFPQAVRKRLIRLSLTGYETQSVVMESGHSGPYKVKMAKRASAKAADASDGPSKAARKTGAEASKKRTGKSRRSRTGVRTRSSAKPAKTRAPKKKPAMDLW